MSGNVMEESNPLKSSRELAKSWMAAVVGDHHRPLTPDGCCCDLHSSINDAIDWWVCEVVMPIESPVYHQFQSILSKL